MERQQAYDVFCQNEQLKKDEFNKLAGNCEFSKRLPLVHEIKELPIQRPPLPKHKSYYAELHNKTSDLLSCFNLRM